MALQAHACNPKPAAHSEGRQRRGIERERVAIEGELQLYFGAKRLLCFQQRAPLHQVALLQGRVKLEELAVSVAPRGYPSGQVESLCHLNILLVAHDNVRAAVCCAKSFLYSFDAGLFVCFACAVNLVELKELAQAKAN